MANTKWTGWIGFAGVGLLRRPRCLATQPVVVLQRALPAHQMEHRSQPTPLKGNVPALVVGHELLILGGVAVAVGAWFVAHRHGRLHGQLAASTQHLRSFWS